MPDQSDILDKWNLYDKLVAIVSDNARNVKNAIVDVLKKRNHNCVAHTLNLMVKDCLEHRVENEPELEILGELINKCRAIVTHFKQSPKSSYKLLEMQRQMNCDELKLIQDVTTRWNSTMYMMERLLKVKVPLAATFSLIQSSCGNVQASEWEILADVVPLLKPIEKMTVN